MIPRLEGWTWQPRIDGVTLSVARPDLVATIHYAEGLRSIDEVSRMLREHRLPLGAVGMQTACRALERLVTHEGEHAAIARFEGDAITWVLGFVFADAGYSYLEGSASAAHAGALEAVVRDLVRAERLQLGVRRRRYLFQPPPWQRASTGALTAHFVYGPGASATRISVYPAIPCSEGELPTLDLQRVLGEDLLAQAPGPSSGFAIVDRSDPDPIALTSGLTGTRWRFTGRWGAQLVERDVVVLRDHRYAYAVELVSSPEDATEARAVFDALVATIEPVPRAADRACKSDAFHHWAD